MDIRVGCKRDARKALAGALENLDHGAFRDVYVDARHEVVYKVAGHQWMDDSGSDDANRDEYANFVRVCDMGGAGHVAPTTAWIVNGIMVIAQPFYRELGMHVRNTDEWRFSRLRDSLRTVEMTYGLDDLHAKNWAVDPNGNPVVIDLNFTLGGGDDWMDEWKPSSPSQFSVPDDTAPIAQTEFSAWDNHTIILTFHEVA